MIVSRVTNALLFTAGITFGFCMLAAFDKSLSFADLVLAVVVGFGGHFTGSASGQRLAKDMRP